MLKEYRNCYKKYDSSLVNDNRQDTVDIRSNFKDAFEHHDRDKDFFYSNLSQPFDLGKKVTQWKKITYVFFLIVCIKIYAIFQDKTIYELGEYLIEKIDKISISKKLNASESSSSNPEKKTLVSFSEIPQEEKKVQKLDEKEDKTKREKFFDPMDVDSEVEINMLANLKAEKEKIDKAKEELKSQQESSVLAKEEISLKLKELKKVEESIKDLLLKAEERKKSQLDKYIKIIEGMKTKNAAVIFDKLDMDLLKEIVSVMNTRKVSMILDQMNPAKAKELLTLSMTQKVPYAP